MNAHILLNSSHGRFLILLICCLPLRGGWCSTQDPNYSRQDAHSSVFLNDRTARSRTSSTARVLPAYSDGQVSASGLRSSVLQTQHLSIGALRERLKQRGVSEKQIRSCVEKRELVALVQSLDENEDALPARAECLGVDGHMHLGMDAASRCRGAVVASALEQLQKHKVGGGLQRRSVPSQEGKDSSDLVRLPTSAQAMTSRCTGKRGVAEQDAAMSIGDRERRTSVYGQEAGHRTKRGVEQHGGEEHPQRDGGRGAGGTGVKFSVLGGGERDERSGEVSSGGSGGGGAVPEEFLQRVRKRSRADNPQGSGDDAVGQVFPAASRMAESSASHARLLVEIFRTHSVHLLTSLSTIGTGNRGAKCSLGRGR